MEPSSSKSCIICSCDLEERLYSVTEKGLTSLIAASIEKSDVHTKLSQAKATGSAVFVHNSCRITAFNDVRKRTTVTEHPSKKRLRSSSAECTFNWNLCCFLCSNKVSCKNARRDMVRKVRTIPIRDQVLAYAYNRNDEWGWQVVHRLESCIDLVAAEAVYHHACLVKFRKGNTNINKPGRPVTRDKDTAFNEVCAWMEAEGDSELLSVQEAYLKMFEFCNSEIYCKETLVCSPVYCQ